MIGVRSCEGLLWMECKALYTSGVRVYLLDSYNWIDFIVLSMYLSSYALRFLVDRRIKLADLHYNGTTRARDALAGRNFTQFHTVKDDIFADCRYPTYSYFMKACEFPPSTVRLPCPIPEGGGRSGNALVLVSEITLHPAYVVVTSSSSSSSSRLTMAPFNRCSRAAHDTN